ncbi:AMP-binding protein [Corynebacterium parakroppenstedtii]|uniref:AMP-binding protein n=1 Tax=Corynebacterium parakroppenstedtii TaxID=2828363 RepID=UPI001C8F8F31|nr:AMP-binding protein [Corynebacterium parakroppenstedtii]MBY0793867.1 AMP-binding protein [Corynebacterium parakroppenstedtii]
MNSRRVLGNHSLASQPHTLTRTFADQVDATPDALAIDTGTQTITYARLSQRYHEIADDLRAVAGRGDHVGIAIADPIEYYAALLATMSIGAAYVPVSATSAHGQGRQDADLAVTEEPSADHTAHDSPNSRDSIARRSAAGENRSATGNNGRHQSQARGGTVPYSALTSRPRAIPRSPEPASGYSLDEVSAGLRLTAAVTDSGVQSLRPATRQAHKPSPSDAAAVFFGRRSLVLPHRCATAGINAETHLFVPDDPIGAGDRIGAIASHTDPRSVEEKWLAWSTGACLVPYTNDAAHEPTAPTTIDRWIADRSISVISTTPSDVLSWHTDPTALRLLILGGEPCPADITRVMAGREVWNTYRTEATGVTSAAKITPETPLSLMGQPLAGWEATVIDEVGHPVEPGRAGELVISGVGLAHYFDLIHDAETFAPVSQFGWNRAYRTGDLVTVSEDGLHFVRHIDEQARISGHRVDLIHVDAVLHDLPGADDTTAALTTSTHGPKLLGYVQSKSLTEKSAQTYLARRVPRALMPSIHVVNALPHQPEISHQPTSSRQTSSEHESQNSNQKAADTKTHDASTPTPSTRDTSTPPTTPPQESSTTAILPATQDSSSQRKMSFRGGWRKLMATIGRWFRGN